MATLLGLSAIFVAKRWIKHVQTSHQKVYPVVVAKRDIHYLEQISANDIRLIHLPPDTLPTKGAQSEIASVTGRIATQPIYEGEFIMEQRLVTHISGSALSHTIQKNTRAVTVRVNDVTGGAGFITPGCFVDVVASHRINASGAMHTETIAHVIKVLAIDQESSPEKNQPLVARAVTLEASPDQAERIIEADEEGSIQLLLRHPLDKESGLSKHQDTPTQMPARPSLSDKAGDSKPHARKIILIRGHHAATVECSASDCEESSDESQPLP